MTGRINNMINSIIDQRAKGNNAVATTMRTKLMLKGINPDKYDARSPDDERVIEKLQHLAKELNIKI